MFTLFVGHMECEAPNGCVGMSVHANFNNAGMAALTLFRIATGDNWLGIMRDALSAHQGFNFSVLYFIVFVVAAQFVLLNVVVAVLMKNLIAALQQNTQHHDHEEEGPSFETRNDNAAESTSIAANSYVELGGSSECSNEGNSEPSNKNIGNSQGEIARKTGSHELAADVNRSSQPEHKHIRSLLSDLQERTARLSTLCHKTDNTTEADQMKKNKRALKASLHLVMVRLHNFALHHEFDNLCYRPWCV